MKTNELRIGNLVYRNTFKGDVVFKVEEIRKNCVVCKNDNAPLKTLNPIPLTEDILLKCGFEKFAQVWYRHKTSGFEFALSGLIATNSYFGCFPVDCCNYLHQLQNLYFALTNEELNIEL